MATSCCRARRYRIWHRAVPLLRSRLWQRGLPGTSSQLLAPVPLPLPGQAAGAVAACAPAVQAREAASFQQPAAVCPPLLSAPDEVGAGPICTALSRDLGARGGRKKRNHKPTYICQIGPQKVPTYLFFFFLFFFKKVFIAFLRVSRHGEPRNSEKPFLEIFWS